MNPAFSLIRLDVNQALKPFDCGDDDLNDFFLNNAKNFQAELLGVTYMIESATETVAFFTLLNDKISVEQTTSSFRKRLTTGIARPKSLLRSFPAVKLGRLGVNVNYKGQGIGTEIINYLMAVFVTNNRTGCKFITVDAYRQSLQFYERNGFAYFSSKDLDDDTRLMYRALKPLD